MGILLTQVSSDAPVSLAEAKAWCSIEEDNNRFDSVLELLIAGTVRGIERYLGKSISQATWAYTLDRFCHDQIELPRGPVTGIQSFTYLDDSAEEQNIDPASYVLDITSNPQRIVLLPESSWPSTADRPNAVTITFKTEMVQAQIDDIKLAILRLVSHGLDNREEDQSQLIADMLHQHRNLII
jgi:uncharacterized phiE125 gp8 family phage protein